jgi:hypothetical protein
VRRPTRSVLTFGRALRQRTSGGKPPRMLITRRKPASQSSCSFLSKVHGQSFIRHGQSFSIPGNARRQCKDRPWLTNADWMIGGDLGRASGLLDHRAEPQPAKWASGCSSLTSPEGASVSSDRRAQFDSQRERPVRELQRQGTSATPFKSGRPQLSFRTRPPSF